MKPVLMFVCLLATLVTGRALAATPYENFQEAFEKSSGPKKQGVLGYWAGTCVHSHDQENRWPAVYVNKTVLDAASNTEHLTQTYFWERRQEMDFFKRFSVNQLSQYDPYVQWSKKEQWNPVETMDQALTNTFRLSEGGKMIRSLRVYETEFSKAYYLRVVRKTEKSEEVISYCEFTTPLLSQAAPTEGSTFWIHTGILANTWAEVKTPLRVSRSLIVRKRPQDLITLTHVEVVLADGRKLFYENVSFPQGNEIELLPGNDSAFQVVAVRFYIAGATTDLEIYGRPL